jgi:hypothetical protein
MADDWIKVRVTLHTHPKVVRIVCAVCAQLVRDGCAASAQRCMVVGALHQVWSLFDAHSRDGILEGYSLQTVDELVGIPGFSNAMGSVGWLTQTDKGLEMRDFDIHNGMGAKRRADHAAQTRVRRMCATGAHNSRTECAPEKRREEKSKKSPHSPPKGDAGEEPPKLIPAYSEAFNRFWARYPRAGRHAKVKAFGYWQRDQIERPTEPGKPSLVEHIMLNLEKYIKSKKWQDGYVQHTTTYLNQRLWANDPPSPEIPE